jgi:exodeoxyribonuclease-5
VTFELDEQQQTAVTAFQALYNAPTTPHGQCVRLAGHAGTGKSAVVAAIHALGLPRVIFCAPTGKAASVLRAKGVKETKTFHSVLYYPFERDDGTVEFVRRDFLDAEVVVIDEASMLSKRMVQDIEALVDKIYYVGDHGQLPPVGEESSILDNPTLTLEVIHRQEEGSGIITFSHLLRNGQQHPINEKQASQAIHVMLDELQATGAWHAYLEQLSAADRHAFEKKAAALSHGDSTHAIEILRVFDLSAPEVIVRRGTAGIEHYDMVLCGKNETRQRLNAGIRARLGFSGPPQVGERVVFLRNARRYGVWNGMTGVITEIDHKRARMSCDTDEGPRYGLPYVPEQFGSRMTIRWERKYSHSVFADFGWALTTHKAQGSQWDHVAICDEGHIFREDASRWRYTAATRAGRSELWVLKSPS